jgi:hypothetical protein
LQVVTPLSITRNDPPEREKHAWMTPAESGIVAHTIDPNAAITPAVAKAMPRRDAKNRFMSFSSSYVPRCFCNR